MIVVSGIHGNEPSGIFAAERLVRNIQPKNFKGNFYALAGNMKALSLGERYLKYDLNRIWKDDFSKSESAEDRVDEIKERFELNNEVNSILKDGIGPFYIIDLHTTSSKTVPFLTINNQSEILDFCRDFPMPKVSNIDDYVKGAFFTFLNKKGHIAIGFEAGQHDAVSAIDYHEAFLYLALSKAGMYKSPNASLEDEDSSFYEIKERFVIEDDKVFKMKQGYSNFQKVEKGEELAEYDGKHVYSSRDGNIFLPLYQSKGNDGFFIIEPV